MDSSLYIFTYILCWIIYNWESSVIILIYRLLYLYYIYIAVLYIIIKALVSDTIFILSYKKMLVSGCVYIQTNCY